MFPATFSNQITYNYYCTLGTTNPNVYKVLHHNGKHSYFTYHLISTL